MAHAAHAQWGRYVCRLCPRREVRSKKSTNVFRRDGRLLVSTVLCLAFSSLAGFAQQPPASVIQVDLQNVVFYNYDTYDYTKFATDTGSPAAIPMKTFAMHIAVGDIVASNGEPVKGTFLLRSDPMIVLRPSPTPGQAMADITRGMLDDVYLEFLLPDGTSFGTIVGFGAWGGTPPPGAPLAATMSNYAITGGTGAFLGVRGQAAFSTNGIPGAPTATIAEDPAGRRTRSGGTGGGRLILHVLPMFTPEVMMNSAGPAIVHSSDFTLVSPANPAKAGEILSLFATGLGPTRGGVEPRQPFTTDSVAPVNAPVHVLVNGTSAQVLYAGGYPGATNTYQVNFRVPDGTAGTIGIRLSSAWITGSEVKIAAVQ